MNIKEELNKIKDKVRTQAEFEQELRKINLNFTTGRGMTKVENSYRVKYFWGQKITITPIN